MVPSSTSPDAVMPIAIVGISGRFPGEASSPEKLWDMISKGRSALSDVPKDRFNVDSFYHPHNERQGTINVRKAHFMDRDVSAFDAPFFNMPMAEAKAIDPQQRMALECSYEALENAGLRMEDVDGSNTSCYVGCFTRDYSDMLACDPEALPLYSGTGTGSAIMSNRVSWFFNMKGPSISLDTACSSSMAALHLGCQSLRTGESTMSLVGGTNLMLLPDIMGAMTRLHFLSPDGKCQSFDHKANGYSRGEGAAFCVLKPLDLALRDGDVIRGVIRNTAVNQDGRTPGITLPAADAQEALIRKVYSEADLNLADTSYVEAHGTGTPAGDPVEAGALGATFGKSRTPGNPLYMGSVKSNVGHLEGGSGLVQVVKAVMMLEKGEIPPSIWYEKPNPRIPMDEWNLAVPTRLMPWPVQGLRRISINSFGYGGTNAHCIIDDAYHYLKARSLSGNHNVQRIQGVSPASSSADSSVDSGVLVGREDVAAAAESSMNGEMLQFQSLDGENDMGLDSKVEKLPPVPRLFVWSSHEQAGVERNASSYRAYLEDRLASDQLLASEDERAEKALMEKLARTLSQRRSVLPWKSFAVAASCKELCSKLEDSHVKPVRSANAKTAPGLAFVFTGQGAQWYAMGRELYAHPVFRESLEAAEKYLSGTLASPWKLNTELWRDDKDSKLGSAHLSQPICTALQVALVDLLKHWGVVPAAVVGHSSGEIAAAYAKGAITRESAWAIAYHRGDLSSRIRHINPSLNGAMLATGLGPDAAETYIACLDPEHGTATVACVNSPSSTTLSGDASAIDELENLIKKDGHFARKLRVDVAYHSAHMKAVADKYLAALSDVVPLPEEESSKDTVKMFSSLTGQEVKNADLGAEYWVGNMVSQVKFSEAVASMLARSDSTAKRRTKRKKGSVEHLLEVGPHSALQGPLKQILTREIASSSSSSTTDVTYQSILERGKNAYETALAAAGRLFQVGYPVDLSAVNYDQKIPVRGKNGGFLVDMPAFSWNHSLKYWEESHAARAHRFREHPRKDLFGGETRDLIPAEPRYRNILKISEVPWVQYHKVQGAILYPAAGMMIMAIEAMCQKSDKAHGEIEGYELRDVIIGKAIVVPQDEAGVETMLTMKPFRLGSASLTSVWNEFQLYSRKEAWELNCSGLVRIKYKTEPNPLFADEDALRNEQYAKDYCQAVEKCSRAQNPRQLYEHLTSIGLHYGGVFQGLTEIKKGDFQSACRVAIPDTKSTMPHNYEFPHVIHPATLDSIVQMMLPALTSADEDMNEAIVPVSIGNLFVSADMPTEPGVVLPGYSRVRESEFGDSQGLVVVSTDGWEKPLVVFEGVKGTKLSSPAGGSSNMASLASLRKLNSVFHWQEDVSMLEPSQIRKLCAEAVGDLGQVSRQTLKELEIASLIFIKRVLKECPAEEAEGFVWNFKLFYKYMQQCHERGKAGALAYQTPSEEEENWLEMSPERESEIISRVAKSSTDGAVLVKHGEHLPQILRGEIPPLQILMNDNFLHDFYQSGVGTAQHYAQMSFYVNMLAHKNPVMKILEIGAGTGGATLPVLRTLGGDHGTSPRFLDYTFTDISIGYFEKAKEKLAPWVRFMNFAKLNIEEDPVGQGFEEGAYDLIVASNVLHATRFIGETLKNTRKLLKPSGKLVLTEITNPAEKMRFHMIVGSLEGWWYGEDDGRHYGPTLNLDQWNSAMLDAGFNGVEADFKDFEDERDLSLNVLITTASQPAEPPAPKEVLVVLPASPEPDVTALAEKMIARLAEYGSEICTLGVQDAAATASLEHKSCLVLLDAGRGEAFLPEVNHDDWDALKTIILSARDVTYVTRGGLLASENPFTNLMTGMARSIRSEDPRLGLTTVDVEYNAPLDGDATVTALLKVFVRACRNKEAEKPDWEYAIRGGMPMVQRVLMEKHMNDLVATYNVAPKPEDGTFVQEGRKLTLEVGTPGRLDTLRFNDDKAAEPPLQDLDVEIKVKAAGLNFKDVMVAMGQLAQPALGLDCAGIVSRVGDEVTRFKPGDKVVTWAPGAFSNFLRATEAMVQPMPEKMDFPTAASLPVIYSTAHYAIFEAARLRRGETLLIHGAAGGVGQAAIILAQCLGADVFATVSSETKKKLLMENYGIPETHIFSSRDHHFAEGVKRLTNGRGVDVVLNSLAGEALRETWHCIARFGRFVEMGQKDIVGNTGLDMAPFIRNASFISINLLDILNHDNPTASRVFREVMDLVRMGLARPITPINSMPISHIEDAFRLMQTGQHMGKVVLEAHDDDIVPIVPPGVAPLSFQADATYVLVGGSGGLGRCITEWMVKSGARNILLLSRSGAKKASARDLVARLGRQGANIGAWECDVGDEQQLMGVVERCKREEWPPIKGVIQGAMALHDSTYPNMTREQFLGATRCKVQGSWNLHKYLPSDMDFFVLLSSSVGIAGSRGQGNYSAGNSFEDAIAHHRRSQGLKACSIDVGMVLGVGFLAEESTESRVHDNVKAWSFIGIRENEFLGILQAAMTGASIRGGKVPPQLITGIGTGGMMAQGAEKYPWWFNDAKFAHLVTVDTHQVAQEEGEDGPPLLSQLQQANSMDEATDLVRVALVKKLAKSMMVSVEDIEASRPVSSYGVDSLLATELRSWIYCDTQAEVSVFDLMSNIAISSLARKIVTLSKAVPESILTVE